MTDGTVHEPTDGNADPAVELFEEHLGAKAVATFEQPSPLRLPGCVSPTALELPEGLSFDEWAATVDVVLDAARSISFWLGDVLAYGEDHFSEDKYAAAIEMSGLELATLYNAVSVCRAVPNSRRRELLSWSHHSAVASLDADDQDLMLDKAEDHGWTHKELRVAVGRLKKGLDPDYEPCTCPRCGQTVPCPDANEPATRAGSSRTLNAGERRPPRS